MRRATAILTFATLAFAGSSIYLASSRQHERREYQRLIESAGQGTGALDSPSSIVSTAPAQTDPAPAAATKAARPAASGNNEALRVARQVDRQFLDSLRDPERLRQLRSDLKDEHRLMEPGLAHALGVDPETYEKLLDLMVDRQIAARQKYAECNSRRNCDPTAIESSLESFDLETTTLLGLDKKQRLETYREATPERQLVSQLRGQLPDTERLGDEKAESLVAALYDERKQVDGEMEARSEIPGIRMFEVPLVLSDNDTVESLRAQAEAHYRRLHDRAAQVLSSRQLQAYDQLMRQRFGGIEYTIQDYIETTSRSRAPSTAKN